MRFELYTIAMNAELTFPTKTCLVVRLPLTGAARSSTICPWRQTKISSVESCTQGAARSPAISDRSTASELICYRFTLHFGYILYIPRFVGGLAQRIRFCVWRHRVRTPRCRNVTLRAYFLHGKGVYPVPVQLEFICSLVTEITKPTEYNRTGQRQQQYF